MRPMTMSSRWCASLSLLMLVACGPVKTTVLHEYALDRYQTRTVSGHPLVNCLLVTPPSAAAGYETSNMTYMSKPHTLSTFAKNAWVSPPANMLQPLLLQSLQSSGYFRSVVSDLYPEQADYRLDTHIISLRQNFLTKPSQLELTAKLTLTALNPNQPIRSKIIRLHIPCQSDTPYGGVVAANEATFRLTTEAVSFVTGNIWHFRKTAAPT